MSTKRENKAFLSRFCRDVLSGIKGWIDSIADLISGIAKFLSKDIWEINTESISKARKSFYNLIKVAVTTAKESGRIRLGIHACSLSFFSIMALVPFVAVMFFLTGGLGLADYLETTLYQFFEGNEKVIEIIVTSANNIIESASNGLFGAISMLIFIWTIIWLIINIERAFNTIWEVGTPRSLGRKIVYYVGFMLIAPFLIFMFFTVATIFRNSLESGGINMWHYRTISAFVQWVTYYIVSIFALTIVNKALPHTKVGWKVAFQSSSITAFAFIVMQLLYTGTQIMVTRLNTAYGAIAALPLFLVWLNVSWTIILLGAEIAHALQKVREQEIV